MPTQRVQFVATVEEAQFQHHLMCHRESRCPDPRSSIPSSSPRALLGAELRHRREAAGLSQDDLGAPLFVSGSFIGQLEAGTRRMQVDQAQKLDEVLGAGGFFVRNCAALKKSKYPDHFAEAAEAERRRGSPSRSTRPLLIPGFSRLSRTRGPCSGRTSPTATEEVIDELVAARIATGRPADRSNDAHVVDRSGRGGATTKSRQAPRSWPGTYAPDEPDPAKRIIVQVLPFHAGGHPAMDGPLKLMTFPDAPPLAYLDGLGSGQLLDDPAAVRSIRTNLRFAGGQRTVTRCVPGPDRIGGGGLRP